MMKMVIWYLVIFKFFFIIFDVVYVISKDVVYVISKRLVIKFKFIKFENC